MITKFLNQDEDLEMFITGSAGTGKTTKLAEIINTLDKLNITYQVVAYTHKAKEVLIEKLPSTTPISTLHSWLKKRPNVNQRAESVRSLIVSRQYGTPEPLQLLIVDEFSFVGERDYFSIGDLQDEETLKDSVSDKKLLCEACDADFGDGDACKSCGYMTSYTEYILPPDAIVPKPLKVLYIGDLNQLSPVDGVGGITTNNLHNTKFWLQLTTIHRQADTLAKPIKQVLDMLEGTIPLSKIEETSAFIRDCDIDKVYKASKASSKIMLSYTNESVEAHNTAIQGYKRPKKGDKLYNYSLREELEFEEWEEMSPFTELTISNGGIIDALTKYNPLKAISTLKGVKLLRASNGLTYPCIFGVYQNKQIRSEYGEALAKANASGEDSKGQYKRFKTLNDYVCTIDYPHCQTIHKSQGQEFEEVYIDIKDLNRCKNQKEKLKLLYVAMSRAKKRIYTN